MPALNHIIIPARDKDASATFLSFLSKELTAERPVECFSDAYYSPTYFEDFVDAIAQLLIAPERPAVVHVAGPRISRYEFARQYAGAFGFADELIRRIDAARKPKAP